MPLKRKIAVWDMDGPINKIYPEKTANPAFCYDYIKNSPKKEGEKVRDYDLEKLGEAQLDFNVTNKPFLALTLDVLHQNNVESVIGSQRIQYSRNDPKEGAYLESLYNGLDYVFGKDRPYLKADLAQRVGAELGTTQLGHSKNLLIEKYQNALDVKAEDIIFIDDLIDYQSPAEQAGHLFVHAPRRAAEDSVKDNAYLFETLLRTIPGRDIHKAITNSSESKQVKNEFKQQFLTFQFDHLKKVTQWQTKVLAESNDKLQSVVSNEPASKEVLSSIQLMIMSNKWDIGVFGGVKVIDPVTGIKNTVPKGMNEILKVIDQAKKDNNWDAALDKVGKLAQESADKQDHGIFNKRGETTQAFYDKAKGMVQEMREADAKGKNAGVAMEVAPEKEPSNPTPH